MISSPIVRGPPELRSDNHFRRKEPNVCNGWKSDMALTYADSSGDIGYRLTRTGDAPSCGRGRAKMRAHLWLVAVATLLAAACNVRTAPAGVLPSPAAIPIEEAQFIPLGGIRQWVTISGRDRRNPVVLFLHGGPGNPLSPYSRSLYGGWMRDFTIVQWDQRGAGRTFGENPDAAAATLSIDRMSDDGIAVVEHVSRLLGKRNVILVGGSWGSALGVHMVSRRPDLFQAYLGVGQLVSESANLSGSMRRLSAMAAAAEDRTTLEALSQLGPPPWTNPRSFGKLRRLTRTYEAKLTDAAPSSWWVRDAAYASASYQASYEAGEDYSYLQFVGERGGGLLSKVDLARLGTQFRVPIYIVQGAEDLVTVPDVSRAWFDKVQAPRKRYVLVQRAGHDANEPLLAAMYALLAELRAEHVSAAGK